MTHSKWLPAVTALACIIILAVPAAALQIDCDSAYCFSCRDFSQGALTGVCITSLPEPSAGTVKLGTRVIRRGDILTAEQLDALTFHPLQTEADTEVTVGYLPIYADRVEKAASMTICIRGKADRAPVALDSTLQTYKNLPNSGTLDVHDPEGKALTFTLTRAPRRGDVTLNDDGTFTYTPRKNKVGTDCFTFTATDPAGNVSRQATVTVEVLKPGDRQTYSDTVGSDCRFAAEWLRNSGIFSGERVGTQLCFRPQQSVSRGEFLAMLVDVLALEVDADAVYTGFTDECPSWLRPYLAAALRSGLSAGWGSSVFAAEQAITAREAALLLQNALLLPVSTAAAEETDLVSLMAENGIDLGSGTLNRAITANALYTVRQLINAQ